MKVAGASSVEEGVLDSDGDGIIFGDSCERRVFLPSSNEQKVAVADNDHGANQRAPATDPLYALGLFPSSPYAALLDSSPVPGRPEAMILDGIDCVVDGRRARVTVTLRPSKASVLVFEQAEALRATRRDNDTARKRVAHWGARCRVDAKAAARVRGEQFRLRCKTRTERRQKAAEVAAAASVAESSIVQLKVALKDARRATVARATALADALGVNPPRTLLARCVHNEHRDMLNRDLTAGGCIYGGSSEAVTAVAQGSGKGEGSPQRRRPRSPSQSPSAARPRARAGATNPGDRPPSPPPGLGSSGLARGMGWNREWCRLVDTWCRNASARFRSRCAGQVVGSARRLHWLAGSGRAARVRGGGPGGYIVGNWRGSANRDRLAPSETVGAEGWAALAAFGDVADLLEIVGSTGELVVSAEVEVELDSSGPRPQLGGAMDAHDEVMGTRGAGVLESEGSESRAAPLPIRRQNRIVSDEKDLLPLSAGKNEDDTTGFPVARDDSGDMVPLRETAGNSQDGKAVVAIDEERDERQRITRNSRSLNGSETDALNQYDLPQLNNDAGVRPTCQAAPIPGRSITFAEAAAAESTVPQSKERHRSSSTSASTERVFPTINEEAETDVESCSDSEDDEHGGEEDEISNPERGPSPHNSLEGADQSDATDVPAADKAEPADDGESGRETNGPECAAAVATPKMPAVPARARIVLGPSTIEEALTVAPLSAFVLQAARRAQQTPALGGVHHAHGNLCSSSFDNSGALTFSASPRKNAAEKGDGAGLSAGPRSGFG
eukprot:g8638.t1